MCHLVNVARLACDVPIYHWGDIDAGGVRIAAHLQGAFGIPLKLHEMHPELARTLGIPLQLRKELGRLTAQIGSLARWLCGKEARALEQEELDPKAPDSSALGAPI